MSIEKLDLALEECFRYKHSFSKEVQLENCPNLLFLLENFVKKDFSNPYALYLEVTSLCNLRCKHCFFGYNENNYVASNDISTKEMLSLIDDLVENHEICAVNIMGKEPFMNRDILKIIKHIKSYNLYLRIQTNGTLITDEIKNELFEILDKQNDTIQISIDGATPEVHDSIRGSGNFNKAKDAIKMLAQNNYNVILAYTLNAFNVSTTSYLYELCMELGVRNVIVGIYNDYIAPNADLFPKRDDILINCSELIKKTKLANANIFYDLTFLTPEFILNYEYGENLLDKYLENNTQNQSLLKCHHSERIAVMANGDVYLCPSCQTTNREFCLGNIRNQKFSDIWRKRYENVFFRTREFKKSVCTICKYLPICNGGCMVGSYFKYKTMDSPSADCQYCKKLEKLYAQYDL